MRRFRTGGKGGQAAGYGLGATGWSGPTGNGRPDAGSRERGSADHGRPATPASYLLPPSYFLLPPIPCPCPYPYGTTTVTSLLMGLAPTAFSAVTRT